ncbi:hypothetical protein M7775_05700 [Sporomusa sphaeroides DSM 2875]|uniref:hypothetical protein n=1 Tax=Sporomusa sphaeroides TaxID=47679 RepID=UPI00202F7F04|nr:hypothetical protein [Sporomusa sphaeroides]MCM0758070.1 hypothetical protein [Sporomusa sphaeroides DSM 2875]
MGVGKNASVKSHRLGHRITKQDVEAAYLNPASEVKASKGYHPVECVKNGYPLSQAMIMSPSELTFKDGAYLLQNGCTKQDIKRLYRLKHDAALYVQLKALGLHPWPPAENRGTVDNTPEPLPEPVEQYEPPAAANEAITDPLKIAELMSEPDPDNDAEIDEILSKLAKAPTPEQTDEFTWYTRPISTHGMPTATVRDNGEMYLSTEFGKMFSAGNFNEIGLNQNCTKIAIRTADTGYRLIQCEKNSASKQINAGNIRDELKWKAVPLPARYSMSRVSDVWVGVLIP